jgi:superfamily I DNA/RNA helicase
VTRRFGLKLTRRVLTLSRPKLAGAACPEWRRASTTKVNATEPILAASNALKAEEIEEERRLLYVAMTRAKDHLALIVPHRFYVHGQSRTGDQHLYASRSRFIPESVLDQFTVSAWPP